jgi:hypothetical protein
MDELSVVEAGQIEQPAVPTGPRMVIAEHERARSWPVSCQRTLGGRARALHRQHRCVVCLAVVRCGLEVARPRVYVHLGPCWEALDEATYTAGVYGRRPRPCLAILGDLEARRASLDGHQTNGGPA